MTTLADLQALRSEGVTTINQAIALLSVRSRRKTLGELTVMLGTSHAGVTVIADRLTTLGLAQREYDPLDRRIVHLAANREALPPPVGSGGSSNDTKS